VVVKESPDEGSLLMKRYALLEPLAVRVTTFRSGAKKNEVLLGDQWFTDTDLEVQLLKAEQDAEISQLLSRAKARLGLDVMSVQDIKPEDKKLLVLSNSQWATHPKNPRVLKKPSGEGPAPSGDGDRKDGDP